MSISGCLKRHLQKSTTATAALWFLCPLCRGITEIPPQGVSAFKTNHFILGLKRIGEFNFRFFQPAC